MSLSKTVSERKGGSPTLGRQPLLTAAVMSICLIGGYLVQAAPAHAEIQPVATATATAEQVAATNTPPSAPAPTGLPTPSASSKPSVSPSAAPATSPTPAAGGSAPVPPGGQVGADALAKFKAAQGPGGAHMGQGIQQRPGLKSAAQPGMVTAQLAYMPPGIQGLDVSYYQGNVNWQQQRNMGALFAYVKATEDYGYVNPYFASQYNGSSSVGMIRGAYHFAVPNVSSGSVQANFFASNGGAWSGDGSTLPPLLDIEYNPYPQFGNTCYNLSQSDMVNWIADFSNTMYTRTGRYPAIYTTTDWWRTCTGNSPAFGRQPLHIASYTTAGSPGTLPAGWSNYAIWQYSDAGQFAGDQNVFSGSYAELQALATGYDPVLNKYGAMGGSASRLGNQTLSLYCGLLNGGCYRQYDGGQIIWSPATGAQAVYFDGIGNAWRNLGGVDGRLGYPTSDETCSANACSQDFQGGSIYWTTSTNSTPVFATSIGARWRSMGGTSGTLGYPTGSETCSTSACSQTFQGGKIVWTASSGAWAIVQGSIANAWVALGAENGRLGYPIENQTCSGTQCTQGYQGGILVWTSATPATPVWRTSIGAKWLSQGGLSGSLGAPLSSETCQVSTCRQVFANGQVFWTAASGAMIVNNGQISLKWKNEQAENGRFGVPIGDTQFCGGSECSQDFAGGKILKDPSTATPAFGLLPRSGIGALWTSMGGQQARLAYPTTDESCTTSTCTQSFTGGQILWASGIGMGAVYKSGIGSLWRTLGAENGRLGFPTNTESCGATSCTQSFAGGDILWASGVGMGAVYKSGIGGVWRANGAQQGFFGFPTSTETCTSTDCVQYFSGGSIRWSASTGYAITRY